MTIHELPAKLMQHLFFTAVPVAMGFALGVLIGILLSRKPKLSGVVLPILSVFNTIPGIVFIGLLVLFWGAQPATVLVALSYLDELEKAETTVENMRRQLKDYLEDAARAQLGLREVREEAARLKKENEELSRKLNLSLQRLEKGKV